MTGILQGALGGARALLVGWFLPSLINVVVFAFVVAPGPAKFGALSADAGWAAIAGVLGTAVLGLVLAALQTPLYRVLEGYLGWPGWLFRARTRRQLARKHLLRNRVDAITLARHERGGRLADADRPTLAAFRAHAVLGRYLAEDVRKGAVWLALLTERLHRYPVDDGQVAATRLGNAIRRFEEYGYNHYLLDSQVLWHELNAVVPDPVRKQVEDGRTNVDFFVCLLYGHLVVAVAAAADLIAGTAGRPWLVAGALAGLLVLAAVWYRVAVVATDEWAGAVRAMVNLGRAPLAAAMGLTLPATIGEERVMWLFTGDLVGTAFNPGVEVLDKYRTTPETKPKT
ncbi:hypothetical protein [Amycolatopsis sp. NPDC051903]|uniref:hypothetical protein n=1 Tax=Amycolatopsis sp. NPDC051903 TaxID=3363936 RepID=UPI0037B2454C